MDYEIFIRRAHGCERHQKGASLDYFRNLQATEAGRQSLTYLGSADKQRLAVKKYLNLAVAAFIKPRRGRRLNAQEIAQLEQLLPHIEQSRSAAELLALVEQGLAITHPYLNA